MQIPGKQIDGNHITTANQGKITNITQGDSDLTNISIDNTPINSNVLVFIDGIKRRLGDYSKECGFISEPIWYIISAGTHSAALRIDRTAWAWGINNNAGVEKGMLGDNTINNKSSPISVVGNHSFEQISAGRYYTIGLKLDGSVWGWGGNNLGQVGDDTNDDRSSPVSIVGVHSFIKIATGLNTLALKDDGTIWTWGNNTVNGLGTEDNSNRSSPVSVHNDGGIFFTDVGNNNVAIENGTTVWAWGDNSSGQLGDNTTDSRSSPISVVGDHFFTKIISHESGHTLAIKDDGTAWTWGLNDFGQLGDNTTDNKSSPISVIGDHSFINIMIGQSLSGGIKSDGSIYMWGTNNLGQLGDNTNDYRSSPVSVVGNIYFIKASSGYGGTTSGLSMAITRDGSMFTWGVGTSGELGDNTTDNKSSPISIIGLWPIFKYLTTDRSYVQINTGTVGKTAIRLNGTLWAWGNYIPDGSPGTSNTPELAVGDHSFIKTSGDTAIKDNGTVWTWGLNDSGQCGDDTITARSSPVSVIGEHRFIKISGSTHILAIKGNKNLWAWGLNTSGQLGDNTADNKSSPVSIIGDHSFDIISAGFAHSVGIKINGTTWSWGSNSAGQLGDNTVNNKSSPVLVIGNHEFVDITADFFGSANTTGLKSDGTTWGWGDNSSGQLGDNTTIDKSSPISVIGNHEFIKIGPSMGLKSDGSVWMWGYNSSGQCGDNTITPRSSPVSVVGNHSFIDISKKSSENVFCLKRDGSIWGWGDGSSSILGDNSGVSRSSPVSIYGVHVNNIISGDSLVWNNAIAGFPLNNNRCDLVYLI